jgi:hypothetical protein
MRHHTIMATPRDPAAFEVRDALAEAGCAICRLALAAVGRFIASVSYEGVNDLALRAELRASRGFCNTHAYRWLREARSVLGTALIYRDVLTSALRELEGASPPAASAGAQSVSLLGGLRRPGGRSRSATRRATAECPACRVQHDAEARYLDALLTLLAQPDDAVSTALAHSDGLCLPHAELARGRGGPGLDRLLAATVAALGRLVAQLDEVIRKEDYRFRHESRSAAERAAPANAIAAAAGADGLSR